MITATEKVTQAFHSPEYIRHTSRRLEHLASLHIPVRGMSVLELGAGIGDHSTYYIDRDCRITITDARQENIEYLRNRFPGHDIHFLDMERPADLPGAPFDIIHCYGLLYHLGNPLEALQYAARNCRHMLFLETRVSTRQGDGINLEDENKDDIWRAFSGQGCRPARSWIFNELRKLFPHVYMPRTQPNHEEFPIRWDKEQQYGHFTRSIFIASFKPIDNDTLSESLLNKQERHD